ncbi:hypothetical protein LWI28_026426 [Acer negundo]|uniref:Transposase n=1 Tax=Acer negundo TaxID=4023 RepID=A0AAD5P4A5_ACENE|nr:hypothetical protein LWI28_026426 [Acer negundo]
MICDGLDIRYFSNKWIYHGELDSTRTRLNNDQSAQVDDMHGMLHNAFGVVDGGGGGECDGVDLSSLDNDNSCGGDENYNGGDREILNDDARRFYNLLKDVEQELYPGYPRNVKLGLASDGFNPFGTISISHSTWPVVLMIYNLPPWMCMKQLNFIMSLLILRPSAPGNDIDVYLQPLIDELKELWDNGLKTFDASSNQNFNMRAALLWTISDFSAYANFSGWSTKEPFILASQGIQVFYVEDPVDTEWHAVVFTKPRDLYDMDEVANVGDLYVENESGNTENLQALMDNTYDVRDNLPRIMLDSPSNIMEEGDTEDQYGDETDN